MVKWNCPFRSDRSNREKRSTSKGGSLFSKLFRLDLTDPLTFRPKFLEILVEWIAPCNFRQGSCSLRVAEPLNLKLTFSSQNHYHSAVFLQNLCSSKRETLMASQKIQLGTGVRKVWREGGFLSDLAHYFTTNAQKDKIGCLF